MNTMATHALHDVMTKANIDIASGKNRSEAVDLLQALLMDPANAAKGLRLRSGKAPRKQQKHVDSELMKHAKQKVREVIVLRCCIGAGRHNRNAFRASLADAFGRSLDSDEELEPQILLTFRPVTEDHMVMDAFPSKNAMRTEHRPRKPRRQRVPGQTAMSRRDRDVEIIQGTSLQVAPQSEAVRS